MGETHMKQAPIVRRVTVKYFKRFAKQVFELKPMTLLVGTNNHGKTTLLQALSSWQLAYNTWKTARKPEPGPISKNIRGVPIALPNFHSVPLIDFKHLWTDKKTQWFDQDAYAQSKTKAKGDGTGSKKRYQGAYDVEVTVEWETNGKEQPADGVRTQPQSHRFGMQFHYDNEQSIIVKPTPHTESLPESIDSIVLTHVPPFSGLDPFEEFLADGAIRRRIGLCQPGSVVRNLLWRVYKDSDRWTELRENVKRFVGVNLLDPKFAEDIDPHITCQYEDVREGKSGPFDLVNGGSGFHQLVTLFAIVYWNQGTHLLLDEPDAHLHAWAQAGILEFLKEKTRRGEVQVLIATHSLAMLDRSQPEDVYSLMQEKPTWLVADKEKFSIRSGLDAVETSLLTFLQQVPLVLYTEGTTDFEILRIWAGVLGKDVRVFDCLPLHVLGARDPKKAREHFLGVKSFRSDIHGICVLDPDKSPSELQVTIDHQQEPGLEYRVWDRRHLESYLLVPEAIGRAVAGDKAPLLQAQVARAFRDFLKEPPRALLFPDQVKDYRSLAIDWLKDFDAKRIIFSPDPTDNSFVSSQGFPGITPQHVGQAMVASEIHKDVVDLIDRLFLLAKSASTT